MKQIFMKFLERQIDLSIFSFEKNTNGDEFQGLPKVLAYFTRIRRIFKPVRVSNLSRSYKKKGEKLSEKSKKKNLRIFPIKFLIFIFCTSLKNSIFKNFGSYKNKITLRSALNFKKMISSNLLTLFFNFSDC